MTPTERPSSRHILSLDGYRGLAFLLVFIRHYTLTSHTGASIGPLLSIVAVLGEAGWVGVDLFFVLSGFLITGILLDTRDDPHFFLNFIARRALRIFPLYYTVMFGLLALTPLLHLHWQRGHIGYFLYLTNIFSTLNPSLDFLQPYFAFFHLWSLALEEQFYLIWPFVLYFGLRSALKPTQAPRRLIRICLALSAFAFLARLVLLLTLPEGLAFQWSYTQLPTHMDALLYGAIAAALVRLYPETRLAPTARNLFLAASVALVGIAIFVGRNFAFRTTTLIGYPIIALAFASLLILAMQPTSLAARFGRIAPLRMLGRYSYGLYVYHLIASPALAPMLPWLQRQTHSTALGGMLFVVVVFVITLVTAVASYELYERHFLRLKRFFPYAASKPAAPASAITTA